LRAISTRNASIRTRQRIKKIGDAEDSVPIQPTMSGR
jgi:hypothetical protein